MDRAGRFFTAVFFRSALSDAVGVNASLEDASWDNQASSPLPSAVLLLLDAFPPFSVFSALEDEADGGSATFKSSLVASHIPS